MQHVLVIDKNKMFLMPCHPARARGLWRKGKAAVYKRCPFRIIFKEKSGSDVQDLQLKLDPGSKTTTIALVTECQQGRKVVWAGERTHRGQAMRNTLLSRVDNVFTWAKRLINFAPVAGMVFDLCKRFINILARAKAPLQDGGASNSIRYATGGRLQAFGLQVSSWSGGGTTYNRTNHSESKNSCQWMENRGSGQGTGQQRQKSPGRMLAGCLCESPAVSISRQKRVQYRGFHGNIALCCSVPMVTITTWETAFPPPPEGRGSHAVILDEPTMVPA